MRLISSMELQHTVTRKELLPCLLSHWEAKKSAFKELLAEPSLEVLICFCPVVQKLIPALLLWRVPSSMLGRRPPVALPKEGDAAERFLSDDCLRAAQHYLLINMHY